MVGARRKADVGVDEREQLVLGHRRRRERAEETESGSEVALLVAQGELP